MEGVIWGQAKLRSSSTQFAEQLKTHLQFQGPNVLAWE